MKFFIDRIEGGYAVLIDEKTDSFEFPSKYLPQDVGEGKYIDIDIRTDEEYTANQKEEIHNLKQKLLNKGK